MLSLVGQWEFTYGKLPVLTALPAIPIVTTVLTIGLPALTVFTWLEGYWSPIGRLHYSLTTVAALAFIPFLRYWNLLGVGAYRRRAAKVQDARK